MCRIITPVGGFTPYWLDTAASDLSGPAPSDWSKVATTSPVGFHSNIKLSSTVAKNATERGYMFTASGVPGASGANGDYQGILRVDVTSSDIRLSMQVHRVNASGTIQASSATTAEQVANAGVQLHTLASVNLGTWNAGDRIRVDIIIRNVSNSASRTVTFHLGKRILDVVIPGNISMQDQVDVLSSVVT